MSNDSSDFKVQYLRKFTEEGELRDDSNESTLPHDTSNEASHQEAEKENKSDAPVNDQTNTTQEMDFPTLILSLTSTAIFQMGLAPNPATNKTEKNIAAAKQTIDILEILQKKTKGNLDGEESKLLNHCVHDLKMNYLKASQNIIL